MKLLFYINAINGGGAERVMVNLCEIFSDDNDVLLVTSFKDEWEYQVSDKVRRIYFEKGQIRQNILRKNISRIVKLRRLCEKEKPDVVISFMAEPNFRMLIATMGLKCKKIISVRNDPRKEYSGKFRGLLAKYIFLLADGIVFQTQEAKEYFKTRIQLKSKVIWNAVNSKFYNCRPDLTQCNMVAVGRLEEQKNYLMMIKAIQIIVDKYPSVKLKIWGEGKEKESLIQKVNELNLQNNIFFEGQTDSVDVELEKASIFLMTSNYEGLPNSLMEAMAVGLACVSTDCSCGGPRELLHNMNSEFLIPVNDEKLFAQAVIKLIESGDLRKRNASNCKMIAENFKTDIIYQQWNHYIKRLMK